MQDVRYPIGKFVPQGDMNEEQRKEAVRLIADAPAHIRQAVRGLGDRQLDTPYREGGWTVRQVVHHLVDSHLNAFVRFKLTITEDDPMLKTYDEKRWAETAEARTGQVEPSIVLLETLHLKWVTLLESLRAGDFGRTCRHPEFGELNLEFLLSLYSWHGRHHEAHITGLRNRQGW